MEFKTSKFEGPLELLLSLIDEQELGITEVALAEVTEQYLKYLKENREVITLENLSGFLSVAARLILMKSKSLLPLLVLEKEEEDEEEDLTIQLEEYKKFSDATTQLENLWAKGRQSFTRSIPLRKRQIIFTPPDGLDVNMIEKLFRDVLSEIPIVDQLDDKNMLDVVALEERLMSLSRALEKRGTVAFLEFIKKAKSRTDVVVSFLALLELVKQNVAIIQQGDAHGDIFITAEEHACKNKS